MNRQMPVNQRLGRHIKSQEMWKIRSKSEERYVKLHSKLRNSSRKFQSPIDKDVYRDLQNLLVYLKEYQSNKASQLNHADNARLLSHKEFEDMILRDFDKLFGRISQDFYLNLYFNKSLPLVFDIIDWLALNELDNGILLEKLLVNEKVIEGLDFYISSRIILDGGYIEIFKADDIQSYLLKHQNLEEIRNLLNCDHFFFAKF
ncbi:hypothetical protein PPACK8108_LOCUS7544 [Phakopsora pachyrhizi]|uniref:Uncharacterized protein n=1 Tax=Phakopsora pachyrhizi TaxID=170000 RepID=A0AAV0AV77_PHAPC|nr:hypothetical protein PPACK8108_LOCUS7544 [Phakopsora pachyrhizi]